MSTGDRFEHKVASACAREFAAMVGMGVFETWEIAGSVRRGCDWCGDAEHVVVPRFEDRQAEGALFGGETTQANLLHERLDELLDQGLIEKARYGPGGTTRWGPRYRGVVVVGGGRTGGTPIPQEGGGMKHEVFMCTPETLGNILAIRTGPSELSKRLVTRLLPRGYRCQGGEVIDQGTGRAIPVRDEAAFFALCGLEYVGPTFRGDLMRELEKREARGVA